MNAGKASSLGSVCAKWYGKSRRDAKVLRRNVWSTQTARLESVNVKPVSMPREVCVLRPNSRVVGL